MKIIIEVTEFNMDAMQDISTQDVVNAILDGAKLGLDKLGVNLGVTLVRDLNGNTIGSITVDE